MLKVSGRLCLRAVAVLVAVLVVCCAGCGYIADKDRIKIGKLKDRFITRGDLAKYIRDMPDDERPIIRNRGDLLRVLNQYIDEQIKVPLAEEIAQQLESQGKILVARQVAQQKYFQQHSEDNYAEMYFAKSPEAVGITQVELDGKKQQIDVAIDQLWEKLKGDSAVAYRALEMFKQGTLTISDAEYEQEYRLRKDDLKKLEWIRFWAFSFPADMPNSEAAAAAVRKRLDAGETFDALMQEYAVKMPQFVQPAAEIENNPSLSKFQSFWNAASGSQKGDILGPVFLPEFQIMAASDPQGQKRVKDMPAVYMILQVLDHQPETTMTLDEAKKTIGPNILIAKTMEQLRQENGVEIYNKSLEDPAMFGDQSARTFGQS